MLLVFCKLIDCYKSVTKVVSLMEIQYENNEI